MRRQPKPISRTDQEYLRHQCQVYGENFVFGRWCAFNGIDRNANNQQQLKNVFREQIGNPQVLEGWHR